MSLRKLWNQLRCWWFDHFPRRFVIDPDEQAERQESANEAPFEADHSSMNGRRPPPSDMADLSVPPFAGPL